MEPTPSRRIILSFVLVGVFGQLYCYCQVGQFIQDEAGSIGNAAYNTNWVNVRNPKVKMGLMLIIIRAQKTVNITMGGFMILSLESFSTIVRASFSFLTFLENMKS
ncbi:Odorant receptor 82a [Carabus blaptoides fortunei]